MYKITDIYDRPGCFAKNDQWANADSDQERLDVLNDSETECYRVNGGMTMRPCQFAKYCDNFEGEDYEHKRSDTSVVGSNDHITNSDTYYGAMDISFPNMRYVRSPRLCAEINTVHRHSAVEVARKLAHDIRDIERVLQYARRRLKYGNLEDLEVWLDSEMATELNNMWLTMLRELKLI